MIPVAALLILLVALFTLAVVINSNSPVELNPNGTFDLSIFGARVAVNELGLFCTGAGVMLVLIIALVFLRAGLRRSRISRRERKNLLNAASGQGKVARKEPSSLVLPGRAGAVSARPEAGPSASNGPAGPTSASATSSGATSSGAGTLGTTSPTGSARGTTADDEAGSAPRLSVPPMKSPPPEG